MRHGADLVLKRLAGLRRETRGVVLIEFALVMPVMLTMYLGAYVVSEMVMCNRKVTVAATTLADLVSHNMGPSGVASAPTSSDASSYLSGGALVMSPFPLSGATETITLLRVCSTTRAYVVWSQSQTQNDAGTVQSSPVTSGSTANPTIVTLPSGLLAPQSGSGTYYPLAPTSTTQSNTNIDICGNTSGSGQTPVVGSAGAYLYVGSVSYNYRPAISYTTLATTQMAGSIYMIPRQN